MYGAVRLRLFVKYGGLCGLESPEQMAKDIGEPFLIQGVEPMPLQNGPQLRTRFLPCDIDILLDVRTLFGRVDHRWWNESVTG